MSLTLIVSSNDVAPKLEAPLAKDHNKTESNAPTIDPSNGQLNLWYPHCTIEAPLF